VVGDDAAGAQVSDLVAAEAGAGSKIVVEPGRQTTIKERFVAGGQQLLRSDRETAAHVKADTHKALVEAAQAIMRDGPGVLVLSDYGKGLLTPAVTAAAIAAARGGSLEMLRLLVESGADVAAGVPGDANPLILAVRNGDRPMVEYLLAHGANPSADVPGDENALVAAAESGDRDMMRLLMNDGRGD